MPKWTFGLNLFAEWKGLDATFLFQGAADVQGYLAGPGVVGEMIGAKGKPSYMYRDCWDAETNPMVSFREHSLLIARTTVFIIPLLSGLSTLHIYV